MNARVELFKAAFPEWRAMPEGCWISQGIRRDQNDLWKDAVACLPLRSFQNLVTRLRQEHPWRSSLPAKHSMLWDGGVQRLMTEVEAFAWGQEIAGYHDLHFVEEEGSPDIRSRECWIEAKTVTLSEHGRMLESLSTFSPAPQLEQGFLRKFDSALTDAVSKKALISSRLPIVVFICLANIDLDQHWDEARTRVIEWAEEAERLSQTNTKIVVIYNHNWETPFYCRTESLPS